MLISENKKKNRCNWAQKSVFHQYHDNEWGKPVFNDSVHLEFLILEGAQAGLNWEIILKKRENYRQVFKNFNPQLISQITDKEVQEILKNPGIVRNKLKIKSAIKNACVFLEIQKKFGSFNDYIWQFTKGEIIINQPKSIEDIPTISPLSDLISKDLKKRGMSFVGSTIIYAYLQAIGIINDHEKNCDFA